MLTPDDEQHVLKLQARLSGTITYLEEQNNTLTAEVQRLRSELEEANAALVELRTADGPVEADENVRHTSILRESRPSS